MLRKSCFIVIILSVCAVSWAELKLASAFTNNMVLQRERAATMWGWARPNETITVQPSWEDTPSLTTQANAQGKWELSVSTPAAGGPYDILISGVDQDIVLHNVLIGEVWICSGQSNMEWGITESANAEAEVAAANYSQLRLLVVPRHTASDPVNDIDIQWHECSPQTIKTIGSIPPRKGRNETSSFSAVAYFFGRKLHQELGVPVGLIQTAFGGTPAEAWTDTEHLQRDPEVRRMTVEHWADYDEKVQRYEKLLAQWPIQAQRAQADGQPAPPKPQRPDREHAPQYRPQSLYNGMLHPLIPYTVRGVIWYQGESNTGFFRKFRLGQNKIYRQLFSSMIQNWRDAWRQPNMPFYFVQIAPWPYGDPQGDVAAYLREGQLQTWQTVPHTGMVVTTDIGDLENIHPLQKREVGERLALWALAHDYGKDVVYSGPAYRTMTKEGHRIRLSFDHVDGGLVLADTETPQFEIAGADMQFVPAQAVLEDDTVVVSSPTIADPVAVRYGWRNGAEAGLWNQANLPASPFRTDR